MLVSRLASLILISDKKEQLSLFGSVRTGKASMEPQWVQRGGSSGMCLFP
jgi:hypothetical protein